MKWVIRGLLIVVILLVAAGVGTYFYLDTITRAAIQHGTEAATGVNTSLQSAHVQPFAGKLSLKDLVIDNPTGFTASPFLHLGRGDVTVALGSLMENTVDVPSLALDRIDLHLIRRNGKTNYQVILDNIQKTGGSRKPSAGKKFIIHNLNIENVSVTLTGYPGGERTIKLPPIHLENVGTAKGANGVPMDQLTGVVIASIFQSMIDNVANLPDMLNQSLNQFLAQSFKQLQGLGGADAGRLLENGAKVITDTAGKALDQGVKQIGKSLGELLGKSGNNGKKPADQPAAGK